MADTVLHYLRCAAIARGCTSALVLDGPRGIDPADLDPEDPDDARMAHLLAANGWRLEYGKWICAKHPEGGPPAEPAFGHEIRFFLHPAPEGSRREHYFGATCSCRTWNSGLNALKWVLFGIQQHLEEHDLTWPEGNLVDAPDLERALEAARTRLAYAREVLLKDGYFTEDQVNDDIAPRIGELCSHLRHRLDQAMPAPLLEALDQLRVQIAALPGVEAA